MQNLIKTGLSAALKSWITLLCFEMLYKVIGSTLLFDLADSTKAAILKLNELTYISQENIGTIFRNPTSLLLLLGTFTLLSYYVYFEISALIIYCEAGWQGRYISIWSLCKKAMSRSLCIFQLKNLPIFLALLPLIALSIFPLTNGFLNVVRIPEFILDYVLESPMLFALFALAMILMNLLLFFYLFSFPSVILEKKHFFGSLSRSKKLLKGRKLRTAAILLGCALAIALLVILSFICLVFLLWLWSKWPNSNDGGKALFQFYYLRFSSIIAVIVNVLGALTLCTAIVTLSHHYQNETPPKHPPVRRTRRKLLLHAASVTATLALLLIYSETELGGTLLYAPENPDTVVVAHRAGAAFAPENTLAALQYAIDAKADIAEIDVQQTQDKVLIAAHDNNLKRTTGVDLHIGDADYSFIRKLDAGAFFSSTFKGEHIPTLEEMLSTARDKIQLMIELKSTGHERSLVSETIKQIEAAKMTEQCMLASMDLELLRQSKEQKPELRTVYITTLLFLDLQDLDYVDAYSVETSFLTAALVSELHSAGKKVYVWTANRDENMRKILRSGADGLVTDNPELARYYLNPESNHLLLQELSAWLY